MTQHFADTFYFLALRNRRDAAHSQAVELTALHPWRSLVTTGWVLTEVADALAAPANRQGFIDLLSLLRSEGATVVSFDDELYLRGIDLYGRRPDKAWSLTDCVSFVVMEERGIREALTGDRHFEQAGFVALLM